MRILSLGSWRALGLLSAALLLGACLPGIPLPSAQSEPPAATQPSKINGKLKYSNDVFTEYHTRHAIALADMHGFVIRDPNWEIALDSLVYGALEIDTHAHTGEYTLQLPARPAGAASDVDHNGSNDAGVQIFTLAYWSDPFSAVARPLHGWPTYLTSTVADGENGDEITGGMLVVWAPDDAQQFPTDFGPDGLLFTDDDPVAALPAGYSAIDLDVKPFAIRRTESVVVDLREQAEDAVKDYSHLGYVAAFQRLYEQVHRNYAFKGIAGKDPNWPELYDRVAEMVKQAEQDKNPTAFLTALQTFVDAFHDGHVTLDGGELGDKQFDTAFGGGYGFAMRETDDGTVIAVFVDEHGPAAQAGMQRGAEIAAFGGQPIAQAIKAVVPPNGPFSTERARRYEQVRYLPRRAVGTSVAITFANPGAASNTVTLQAIDERDSLQATSLQHGADPTVLPVEYRILDSGLGYVRVNSNDDDLDLIDELFFRALNSFEYHDVPGVLVDLRQNDGGSPLDLAGYLTDKPIRLGKTEYYSEASGAFESSGYEEEMAPSDDPFHFNKLAVLVDQACYSACEIEAYGFSRLPGSVVVGFGPTAGVEAEVSQGQFMLPEDIWMQFPTGRVVKSDGSLFLEGRGVAPTLRVPSDEKALLSGDDLVLHAAENALLRGTTR